MHAKLGLNKTINSLQIAESKFQSNKAKPEHTFSFTRCL